MFIITWVVDGDVVNAAGPFPSVASAEYFLKEKGYTRHTESWHRSAHYRAFAYYDAFIQELLTPEKIEWSVNVT